MTLRSNLIKRQYLYMSHIISNSESSKQLGNPEKVRYKHTMLMCFAFVLVLIVTVNRLKVFTVLPNETLESPIGKYVFFASTTPTASDLRTFDNAFYLPLTALAWRRFGYRSIVLITGTREEWEHNAVLSHVLDHLSQLNSTVIVMFTDDHPDFQRPMVNQITGPFANYLLHRLSKENDIVITSSTNLWPLKESILGLSTANDLLLVDNHFCGNVAHHNGEEYRMRDRMAALMPTMVPISYLGARVGTWRQIMDSVLSCKRNQSKALLCYPAVEFSVRRNLSSYPSQYFINAQVNRFVLKDLQSVYKISRTFDTVERTEKKVPAQYRSIRERYNSYDDIRLPYFGYKYLTWMSLQHILRLMYGGKHSSEMRWANKYAVKFRKQMEKIY